MATLFLFVLSFVSSNLKFGIINFEPKAVSNEDAIALTNIIKSTIGEHVTVVSDKFLEDSGLLKARSFSDGLSLASDSNLDFLIQGEIIKVGVMLKAKLLYGDLKKGVADSITVVRSSIDSVASLLSEFIINNVIKSESEKSFGSVYFETDPAGADILLNGELLGTTPGKVDFIPIGEHSVLLSKRGYTIGIKLIVVYPGRTTSVSMALTPIPGSFITHTEMPIYLIDEVIVRGVKIRERVYSLPKGVEVISKEIIERSGAKDIPSLLSHVSGVSVKDPTGSGVSTALMIRGMDPSKYTTVTLDGIVINSPTGEVNWNAIPIELVNRIEIVKGGSPMHGGKAAGGVINIVTKERDRNQFILHSTNVKDIGTSFTLSAYDNWALWINSSARLGNGWRKEEKHDMRSLYSKFSLPVDEQSNIFISLDAQMNKNTVPGGLTKAQLKTPEVSGEDKETKYQQGVKLMSGYEVKTTTADLSIGFWTMPEMYESKQPLLNLNKKLDGIRIGGNSVFEWKNFRSSLNTNWSEMKQSTNVQVPDNSYTFDSRITMEWDEKYGALTMKPGLCYQWFGYWLEKGGVVGEGRQSKQLSFITPMLGLIWTTPVLDIFASFEETMKEPEGYEKVKNVELKPEKLELISTGVRMRQTYISGSISSFYINLQDPIIMKNNTYVNAMPAKHSGIESDITLRVTDAVSYFANFTQINARFVGTEERIPGIREKEVTFGIRMSKMPTFSFTGSYNWYGKSYIKDSPIAPYSSLDCNFRYRITSIVSCGIWLTNLLDEKGASFGYERESKEYFYPIHPRGFRMELSVQF